VAVSRRRSAPLALALAACSTLEASVAFADASFGERAESETPAATAGADPTDEQRLARAHFIAASEHAQNGDWHGALKAYQTAYRLFPSASTLYNVGYCHAQLGNLVSAWHATVQALDDTRFAAKRRLSAERRQIAVTQRDAVLSKLAVVTVDGASLHAATVDGVALVDTGLTQQGPFIVSGASGTHRPAAEPAAAPTTLPGSAVVYLDPGPHVLVLSSNGRTLELELELAAGERRTVHVEAPAHGQTHGTEPPPERQLPNVGTPPESARAPAPPVQSASSPDPLPLRSALRAGGLSALAVGGLGFGTAIIAGFVAASTDAELSDACGASGACGAEHSDAVDRYQNAVRWTNAGLLVGTVASATGLGLLLLVPADEPRGVALGVTVNGAYLGGRF
jgi:hypothetical protein